MVQEFLVLYLVVGEQFVGALCYKTGGSGINSRWAPCKLLSDLFLLFIFSSSGVRLASNRKLFPSG